MGLITDLLNKAAKEAKDFLKDCGVLESEDIYVPPTENKAPTPPEPKEPQKPIIPECNNGECGVYEYHLYHSCEKSAQCPKMLKKKYYNAMRTVSDKRIFDFIIRYAKDEKTYDYKDKERIPGEYSDAVFPNLSEIKRFIVNVVLPFESMDPNESLFIKFLLEMNDKCVAKESYGPNLNRLYTIRNIPFLKYRERSTYRRIILLQGCPYSDNRSLLNIHKMLCHSIPFTGRLRYSIQHRLLVVQIPQEIR